jgi:hypothetical protein
MSVFAIRLATAIPVCLILSVGALSSDVVGAPPVTYKVYGTGGATCDYWLTTQHNVENTLPYLANGGWVLGFVSGVDYQKGGELSAIQREGVSDINSLQALWYVNSYCSGHPGDTIAKAAESLVRQLAENPAALRRP